MVLQRSVSGFKKKKGIVFILSSSQPHLPLELFILFLYVCSLAGCFLVLVQSIIFYSGMEHFIPLGIASKHLSLPNSSAKDSWSNLRCRKGQNSSALLPTTGTLSFPCN